MWLMFNSGCKINFNACMLSTKNLLTEKLNTHIMGTIHLFIVYTINSTRGIHFAHKSEITKK